MSNDLTPSTETKKILDFTAFKKKQEVTNEISRARKPLFINENEGQISASEEGAMASNREDYTDRLLKIRASLDRINTLMADLKKLSTQRSPN